MGRKIHPNAIVDKGAEIGDGVEVGPGAVVESGAVVGEGCTIMAGAIVRRGTTMGPGNVVHPYCVLGGDPQDLKFDPRTATFLRIGSGNVFREYVTLNRATTPDGATVIGSRCFFMTGSHVGHDASVADEGILTNHAAIGGHAEVGRRVFLSAHTAIHQFCRVGELAIFRGNVGTSQHVPPFVIMGEFNQVTGINIVGLRRCPEITAEDRRQIQQAYRLLYRSSLTPAAALARMDACADWGAAAGRFRDFVRRALAAEKPFARGLVGDQPKRRRG